MHTGKSVDEIKVLRSKKKMATAKGIDNALGMSNVTGQKMKNKKAVE
jgi:hypothetical protein